MTVSDIEYPKSTQNYLANIGELSNIWSEYEVFSEVRTVSVEFRDTGVCSEKLGFGDNLYCEVVSQKEGDKTNFPELK